MVNDSRWCILGILKANETLNTNRVGPPSRYGAHPPSIVLIGLERGPMLQKQL